MACHRRGHGHVQGRALRGDAQRSFASGEMAQHGRVVAAVEYARPRYWNAALVEFGMRVVRTCHRTGGSHPLWVHCDECVDMISSHMRTCSTTAG